MTALMTLFAQFYASEMGAQVNHALQDRLAEILPAHTQAGLDNPYATSTNIKPKRLICGIGYTPPLLQVYQHEWRQINIIPDQLAFDQQLPQREQLTSLHAYLPAGHPAFAIAAEQYIPLADRSVDVVIANHMMEFMLRPNLFLREMSRILTDDGQLIMMATNRRALWAMVESTPLALGRPFTHQQMVNLLRQNAFEPLAHAKAVHFPPIKLPNLAVFASRLEAAGAMAWPFFGGMNMIAARKNVAMPISGLKSPVTPSKSFVPKPNFAKELKGGLKNEIKIKPACNKTTMQHWQFVKN